MPERTMLPPPARFSGTLDEFYDHVLPILPSPEIVEYYHRILLDYCSSTDPLFLIRHVTGTVRREIYTTARGDRFRATDNAPAWWLHFTMFHERRISPNAFAAAVASAPTHFHDALGQFPKSINAARWHVAHIFQVKDRNTDFARWGRNELIGRFIRNVHPCNYFFLALPEWRRYGGDERVIAFFANRYAERYHAVWSEFLTAARANASALGRVVGPVHYEYDPAEPRVAATVHASDSNARSSSANEELQAIAASYRSTRLLFKAAVIEPLESSQAFQVITPEGTFTMTKADFHRVFPNVVKSRSYREAGVDHYRTAPAAALEFRSVSGEAGSD
jgi:hypothetical protein